MLFLTRSKVSSDLLQRDRRSHRTRSTISSICSARGAHLHACRPFPSPAIPAPSSKQAATVLGLACIPTACMHACRPSSKHAATVLGLADVDDLLAARSVSNRDHLEIEASSVRTMVSFVKAHSSTIKCNQVQSAYLGLREVLDDVDHLWGRGEPEPW